MPEQGQHVGWGEPPPPPQQGGWGPPPQPSAPRGGTNGLAIAALVCGLLALPLAIILVGGLVGVVAVILGIVGLVKAREIGTGRGMAIGGIVAGGLAVIATIGLVVLTVSLFQDADFQEMLEDELQRQEELLEDQGQD
jgi:hypothetical protein